MNKTTEKIPTWSLCYLINGDATGLTEDEIKASIDLDGKEEGSYEVPIKVSLPNGYTLLEDVTAEIKVSKVSNAETENGQ